VAHRGRRCRQGKYRARPRKLQSAPFVAHSDFRDGHKWKWLSLINAEQSARRRSKVRIQWQFSEAMVFFGRIYPSDRSGFGRLLWVEGDKAPIEVKSSRSSRKHVSKTLSE
jgi:hypothetical protein